MELLSLLKRHLGADTLLFETVAVHSRHVMEKAFELAARHPEYGMDMKFVAEASILHDIGVGKTYAPDIHCFGEFPYLCHGYLGREILEEEGLPRHALVCERHTGTGIYLAEIQAKQLPLPQRDLVPVSMEEQLICFADKFYSKSELGMAFSPTEVRHKLMKYGPESVSRFDHWCTLFL
jgi:uncharacterized protein